MPWWGMPFALLLPLIYTVPVSYVYAMTGQSVGINLVAELIPGSLIAGKPLPNMVGSEQNCERRELTGIVLVDLQGLRGAEFGRGDYIRAGSEAGSLYQGCSAGDVYGYVVFFVVRTSHTDQGASSNRLNVYLCACPSRR